MANRIKETIDWLKNIDAEGINFFLSKGSGIEGTVYDPEGKPLAGAIMGYNMFLLAKSDKPEVESNRFFIFKTKDKFSCF